MQHDRNPGDPDRGTCASCGSPNVVGKDGLGEPSCLACRALELGGQDGQASATFELLEQLGGLIAETGLAHPADALGAFAEALSEGAARREKLDLRPVPTFARNLEAISALTAAARGGGEA
jgi:hypothetical protein